MRSVSILSRPRHFRNGKGPGVDTRERPSQGNASAEAWLVSSDLVRLVQLVAFQCRIPPPEIPDLIQETRIALWALPPTMPVSPAWIERTSRNKAIDLLRSRIRARSREKEFTRRTAENARDAELMLLIRSHVAAMPRLVRAFYALHYVAGCSERETAIRLGKSRASLRRLDHRFRRLFGA